jgi:redox-sensitive bicupin YhaK (pirin superfamily)
LSYHTFSFADYYDPQRVRFGVLRVLNDDTVEAGQGFGTHPHDNMEIVSIPLEGDLEHRDSMGNVQVIRSGDVQVMSAGTGIQHSEYNKNPDRRVKFLQIWIFPRERNVQPRYDQITFSPDERHNKLQQILSPDPDARLASRLATGSSRQALEAKRDAGVWIHQDAWFHLGEFDKNFSANYSLKKKGNGVYAFVLKGDVSINDQMLNERDGFGIWDVGELTITARSDAFFLLMEVPMALPSDLRGRAKVSP